MMQLWLDVDGGGEWLAVIAEEIYRTEISCAVLIIIITVAVFCESSERLAESFVTIIMTSSSSGQYNINSYNNDKTTTSTLAVQLTD